MNQYAKMIRRLKSSEAIAALSHLYGQRDGMLLSQIGRYTYLLKRHEDTFHSQCPVHLISAPGRCEVGGNHTDHNNGKVLAAAINLDTLAAVSARKDMIVNVCSEGYKPIAVDLSQLDAIPKEKGTTTALIRGVAAGMKKNGYCIGGFDACVTSSVLSGSGLSSSAAFEVMISAVFDDLYNGWSMGSQQRAKISQYAENVYFGKPSGLLDQMGSATGGLVYVDFKTDDPKVKPISYDFAEKGYAIVVVNTGGSHVNLTNEYSAIPYEMKKVAECFGEKVLRSIRMEQFLQELPRVRNMVGDRAILRAMHYFTENKRVSEQVQALQEDNIDAFLHSIIASGQSSFMYLQNVYCDKNSQELSIALCLSQQMLEGRGAWRVQGGGFAGTTLNFVPSDMLETFVSHMETVFGAHSCSVLDIRPEGAYCLKLIDDKDWVDTVNE